MIIKFAKKHNLFIMADEVWIFFYILQKYTFVILSWIRMNDDVEVYQDNVYAEGSQFHSFKKVLMSMGDPYDK